MLADKQGLFPIDFHSMDIKYGTWNCLVNDAEIIFLSGLCFNPLQIILGNVCSELQPLRTCEMQDAAGISENMDRVPASCQIHLKLSVR